MDYDLIYTQGLQEALVEKEKADAAVKGLIERIAEIKRDQLRRFLEEKRPLESKGFVLVKVSYETRTWSSEAFTLTARFLLKDMEPPKGATAKEIKLMKEYKLLTKEADWKHGCYLDKYVEAAQGISYSLRYLKNEIEVVKTLEWDFPYSRVLQGESFFKSGFSIREE